MIAQKNSPRGLGKEGSHAPPQTGTPLVVLVHTPVVRLRLPSSQPADAPCRVLLAI